MSNPQPLHRLDPGTLSRCQENSVAPWETIALDTPLVCTCPGAPTRSASTRSAFGRPDPLRPAIARSASTRPTVTRSASTRPAVARSASVKPAVTRSASTRSAVTRSVSTKPTVIRSASTARTFERSGSSRAPIRRTVSTNSVSNRKGRDIPYIQHTTHWQNPTYRTTKEEYENQAEAMKHWAVSTTPKMTASKNSSVISHGVFKTPDHALAPKKPGWRFYAAFGCLCLINFVAALDATSLSVALPTVAIKLNGSAIEAFWAGTSFLLSSTVFQPTFAQFSQIFGRKPLLLFAMVLFTAGSIICGLSKNFGVLLAGRSIQGVGGGGLVALTSVIVTDLVPLRERGKWFGFISMQWALGSVSGPVIGGAFAEKASWRWIFWINLPFCGIAFAMAILFLRLTFKAESFLSKLAKVDWIGIFLFVSSTTSILIPLTWGGVMYPWNHWRTVLPLVLGATGIVTFVAYSKYVSTNPLIRGSLFRSRTALVSYFGTLLHGTILWSLLYYLPLYYEVAKHHGPIISGISLFPQTFTVAPAAVVVGYAITRTGHYRWAIHTGWMLTTLGLGLLALLKQDTPTSHWIGLNLVSGLGLGILFPAMSFAVQAPASNKDLPVAAAMFSFFRALGQTIGVALGGVIFQNQMHHNLLARSDISPELASQYSRDASALVRLLSDLPVSQSNTRAELVTSYVDALRVVWAVMCGLAGLALILALWGTEALSVDRELETEQGFIHDPRAPTPIEKDEKGQTQLADAENQAGTMV